MKTQTLAVALLALGLILPPVGAQDERAVDNTIEVTPDQGTIDCLYRLGPECFVDAPEVSGAELYLEVYPVPGCEVVPTGVSAEGRRLHPGSDTTTPSARVSFSDSTLRCPSVEEPPRDAPSGDLGAASHCSPWVHLHGSYSSGAWQGATVAHLHHNGYSNCHAAGGYWWYSGNCGGLSGYGHDAWRITFCDAKYHDVCINIQTYDGQWTGWYCWRQYN